jgi:hypothetical protein
LAVILIDSLRQFLHFRGMNLVNAVRLIDGVLTSMQKSGGRLLFDEYALVSILGNDARILTYSGPRQDEFYLSFGRDARFIWEEIVGQDELRSAGEFGFTRDGEGSSFDAYICVGDGFFLICNDTGSSMKEISEDPQWKKAQGRFLELSERFMNDPLVMGALP